MSPVSGVWYDGASSIQTDAILTRQADGSLLVESGRAPVTATVVAVKVSDRLGRAPRQIAFPQGGVFETADNDGVDALGLGRQTLVQKIERRLVLVLLLLAAVVAVSVVGFKYGIPAAARTIAYALPEAVAAAVGTVVLDSLPTLGLEQTGLSRPQRAFVQGRFDAMAADLDLATACSLHFYAGGDSFGPNAIALPPCTVVVTDEFVELLENAAQLDAVLAHEFGHIHYKHNLRAIVQGSLLAFVLLLMTGDATQISADLAAVPLLLAQLAYSRGFEREADLFAHGYMATHAVALAAFPAILERLECWLPEDEAAFHQCLAGEARAMDALAQIEQWGSYLLTHPPTAERARLFREQP